MSTPDAGMGMSYGSDTSQRAFSSLNEPFTIDITVTANTDAHVFLSSGGSPAATNGYEVLTA